MVQLSIRTRIIRVHTLEYCGMKDGQMQSRICLCIRQRFEEGNHEMFNVRDDTRVACRLQPWYIDEEGNPIAEHTGWFDPPASSRIEFFVHVPSPFIGKLEGWVRLPPKRIVELSQS